MSTPVPTEIKLHRQSKILEIGFDDGQHFQLPCELLRVYSPSAEVRGHGPGQEVLVTGKENVTIESIEPVGSYAIKPRFSDGHDTGIYTWDLLLEMGRHCDELWSRYRERLALAGLRRAD
ncbi:MAG: DUF971 domain-containing protein [Methylotetracoccus sp.]